MWIFFSWDWFIPPVMPDRKYSEVGTYIVKRNFGMFDVTEWTRESVALGWLGTLPNLPLLEYLFQLISKRKLYLFLNKNKM